MKFAIITFPGSNCDGDMYHAVADALGQRAEYVPSREADGAALDGFDGVLLPGGFSYGDYLRSGAMAARDGIAPAIRNAAAAGKPVIGVCNGFQILTEMGLLPGALMRNRRMKFICGPAALVVENSETMFTSRYAAAETVSIPIAHGEGSFFADGETLRRLKDGRRILFTYADNPNGSAENIAGITNEAGNVLGMMPHPERAVEELLGSADGLRLFQSVVDAWSRKRLS